MRWKYREIVKLIRFSPKRAHLFSEKLAQSENSRTGVTLKPLCPTRWTARTGAIGAVLSEYSILMETLEEVQQTTRDEYGSIAAGLVTAIEKFSTLLRLKFGYLLFGSSETLSKSLQGKDITLQEALSSVDFARAFFTEGKEQMKLSVISTKRLTTTASIQDSTRKTRRRESTAHVQYTTSTQPITVILDSTHI